MNEKITSLTPEQEAKFPQYVEKYIKLGMTTRQRTQKEAEDAFIPFQKEILKMETPAPVVLVKSPREANIILYTNEYKKNGQVFDPSIHKEKMIYPYFDCQFWAGYFSFYDFMKDELKIELTPLYDIFRNCMEFGMVYPTDEVCIVVQPPTEIHVNAAGQLHNENGVALTYDGDNEIYSLNGVVMTKEHVMTPAEQIKPVDILKETNVEVRRELLRKVGIERMLEVLPNRLLDKRDTYELYSIDLSDTLKNAKYLKMINPSVGCFHLEGVGPEVNTVNEALNWRNQNMFTDADILT